MSERGPRGKGPALSVALDDDVLQSLLARVRRGPSRLPGPDLVGRRRSPSAAGRGWRTPEDLGTAVYSTLVGA